MKKLKKAVFYFVALLAALAYGAAARHTSIEAASWMAGIAFGVSAFIITFLILNFRR